MCNFLSVILTKESRILYVDGYIHENIIDKYKLKDDKYPNKDWVRIEIVDNDVKVDEDSIPKWYKNRHAKMLLKFSNNMPLGLQLKAVKQYGFTIKYIKNPSVKLQLEAVKQSGFAIKYIENPSVKVQLEAVKQYGCIIKYIKNPSIEVLEYLKGSNE